MQFNYVVTRELSGTVLRSVLKNQLKLSSTMIKRVKLYGTLEVNGVHANVNQVLNEGDVIYAFYDDDVGKLNSIREIPVLYEDEFFAVVIKPSGMVTHPVHGHLDDSLLTLLNPSTKPLHPVMRLDRETSGLMVIAKSGHIHKLFTEQKIKKKYIAAVYGIYNEPEGIIDRPIKRREGSVMIRDVCSCDDEGSHASVTLYKTLSKDEDKNISLVEFELLTGRCHQIRVHSLSMGHPLIGDGLYGPCSIDNPSDLYPDAPAIDKAAGRLALHAYNLEFIHPLTGKPMEFTSDLPREITELSPKFADHL